MTQVLQRYSKRQSTGHSVYEGTEEECRHYMQAEIRRVTHSFLSTGERNRLVSAQEFYNLPADSITNEMLHSPDVFNYMYESFSQYFYIQDSVHA